MPNDPTIPGLTIHGTHQATFTYRNHAEKTAARRVGCVNIWYGTTSWHPEPQWFLHGIDLDKMETRDFAMKDMTDVHFT